jgi:hypothetical protein
MPKSRKRGGEKTHRKRVVARNQTLIGTLKRFQKELFAKRDKLREELSGSTEENVILDEVKYDIKTGKQFYFKKPNED